jgi:hypothetical protein
MPKEGLTNRDYHNGYKASYQTSNEILYNYWKLEYQNTAGDASAGEIPTERKCINYNLPSKHLRSFGCYASRLIPE